jgi:hypothetical protein
MPTGADLDRSALASARGTRTTDLSRRGADGCFQAGVGLVDRTRLGL